MSTGKILIHPVPATADKALALHLSSVKAGVERLLGQDPGLNVKLKKAITGADLVALGLATEEEIAAL